jgi:integrase
MGMIYKRGKTWWIKYYRNGKPYRESTKSHKEADAKRLLKRREGEISQGKLPGVYFDKVRYAELVQDLIQDYEINGKKSIPRLRCSLKHLNRTFEGMRVTQITASRVKAYIKNRLSDGASNATINRELSALKRMLSLGVEQEKVDRVPHIQKLKENNVRKGFFEHHDFLALRIALPSYLRGFVTFGYKYGCRASEIRNLIWNQVDLEQGTVRFEAEDTKNDEPRTILIDSEMKGILSKQPKLCPYVFPNREGTGKIVNYYNTWRRACKAAGIGDKLFHDLRRTAVRNMVRSGIPEVVAMKISGHKTRVVFDRYNIVSENDLREASERLESYLNSLDGHNYGHN